MKATNKILAAFAVLAVMAVSAGFAVNINGAIVNALTGYQFNGAAPNGHVLCGNGSEYVDAASCGASAFYQTMQSNGTPLTQRADLNFTTDFVLTDVSPATRVALASTISSTATNSNAVGGVALSGLCQTGGTGCPTTGVTTIVTVTGSRSFGTSFQNTTGFPLYVTGWTTTNGGNVVTVACNVGAVTASVQVWSATYGATASGGAAGFQCPPIPPTWFYEINASGSGLTGLGAWVEAH